MHVIYSGLECIKITSIGLQLLLCSCYSFLFIYKYIYKIIIWEEWIYKKKAYSARTQVETEKELGEKQNFHKILKRKTFKRSVLHLQ